MRGRSHFDRENSTGSTHLHAYQTIGAVYGRIAHDGDILPIRTGTAPPADMQQASKKSLDSPRRRDENCLSRRNVDPVTCHIYPGVARYHHEQLAEPGLVCPNEAPDRSEGRRCAKAPRTPSSHTASIRRRFSLQVVLPVRVGRRVPVFPLLSGPAAYR